jgi:hypothetical protein
MSERNSPSRITCFMLLTAYAVDCMAIILYSLAIGPIVGWIIHPTGSKFCHRYLGVKGIQELYLSS